MAKKKGENPRKKFFSTSYVRLEWLCLTCGSRKLGHRKFGPNTGLNTFEARLIYTTIQNHPVEYTNMTFGGKVFSPAIGINRRQPFVHVSGDAFPSALAAQSVL